MTTADPTQPGHIVFIDFGLDQAHRIKHLWQQLNNLHLGNSVYHQEHFRSFTFEDRLRSLNTRDKVKIFCCIKDAAVFGYCLASITGEAGEVDSLFIEATERVSGVGSQLMEQALKWFEQQGAGRIMVAVAHGNEQVLPFYQKHGFRERMILLSKEV